MQGGDTERFCAKCARTIVNLSALNEDERQALLRRSRPGELCIAYYKRLTGECVSAEKPLHRSELGKFRQYGYAALSAGALAVAVGCTERHKNAENKKDDVRIQTSKPEAASEDVGVFVLGLPVVEPESESKEGKEPNQTSEPTRGAGTSTADAASCASAPRGSP